LSQPDTSRRCTSQLPAEFLQDDQPVFAEPWQAQAFALTVSLIESGDISWNLWAKTLGEEISRASDHGIAEDGSGYYELWLRALSNFAARYVLLDPGKVWAHPGVQTPTTPDEPDDSTPVMEWKGLGEMAWRRVRRVSSKKSAYWDKPMLTSPTPSSFKPN
jgi:nitrile hydratase accessory protein